MSDAHYLNLGGRHFVDGAFVQKVRDLYPVTTKKIPLGYATYVGWTGKDLVFFTLHKGIGIPEIKTEVYEVTYEPVNPSAFFDKILNQIDHTKHTMDNHSWVPSTKSAKTEEWSPEREAAGGLYGYAKTIQAACEGSIKRLGKVASQIMKDAVQRDEAVVSFLQKHAERRGSVSAKILLATYKDSLPKLAAVSEVRTATKLGLYGFPSKTARLGLMSCTALREHAGEIAAELHTKRANQYEKITGFLGEHSKTGCESSQFLLGCYPDKDFQFKRANWVEDSQRNAALTKPQEKVLINHFKENPLVNFFDDLPQQVQTALRRIKNQETLEPDVDRWLGDARYKRASVPKSVSEWLALDLSKL